MKYTEVDKNGNIVRAMYTENSEAAVSEGNRLLLDEGYSHLKFEWWQYPMVITPVRSDANQIEYKICEMPKNIIEEQVRLDRNALLDESDWTQLEDSPLNETKKNEWKIYRQKLRDLPLQPDFPYIKTFPTKP